MEYQTMIILLATLVIIAIYWVNRKKINAKKDNIKRYDLIIQFNSDSYVDIRKINDLNILAEWKKYGEFGYRGFCTLNKEEIENIIIEVLKIELKDFRVIKGNTGLYIPS